MAAKYLDQIKELQNVTKEYVDKETKRLQNEASALKAILDGRTGGKGIQSSPITDVTKNCYVSIEKFLKGEKAQNG